MFIKTILPKVHDFKINLAYPYTRFTKQLQRDNYSNFQRLMRYYFFNTKYTAISELLNLQRIYKLSSSNTQ